MRLVRKRKVLVLNDRFRPKRPKNGLYQGHTARTSAGNSTNEAFRNPGSLPRPCAHLFTKTLRARACPRARARDHASRIDARGALREVAEQAVTVGGCAVN
eukprot:COSAG02_NODE_8082_length_2719_cov_3.547328_5_plen_101_part_00